MSNPTPSKEELQATNEELVTSNAALQSSNDELHSLNRELDIVNSEYQKKIRELIQLTDDTNNLLSATDIGVIFLDHQFRIRKFTPKIAADFHITPADIGKNFRDIQHSLNYSGLGNDLEWVRENGQRREREISLKNDHKFLLRINPYSSDSHNQGFVLSLVDITSVRAAQQRVEDLSSLVESSNDAIIGFSSTGIITNWNQGAESLYGFTSTEATGQNALELIIPKEESANFILQLEQALEGNQGAAINSPRLTKDGRRITVSQRLSTASNFDHNQPQVSSIERDITKELSLRSDRDRLARVLEETSDFVGICDKDQNAIYVNRAGLIMAGRDPASDPRSFTVSDFHPPNHMKTMVEVSFNHAMEHGSWKGKGFLLRRDGSSIPVSQVVLVHRDTNGSDLIYSTIMRDLSQEQLALENLQKAQRQAAEIGNTLTGVVKNFPEMLVVVDTEQKITFISPDAASFIDAHGENSLPLGLDQIVSRSIKEDQSYQPLDFEGVQNLILNDGTTRSYLPRVTVLHDDHGEITGAVITIQDVTEFRMLDEIKTSLIGTVSHELKNPVAGITMTLALALDGALGELTQEQRQSLEAAMRECHRVSTTIKGLLDLTRFEEEDQNSNRSEEKAITLISKAIKNNQLIAVRNHVFLKSQIASELPTVLCDAERILIVLDNLISNAVKHSPEGSTVTISAKKSENGGVAFSVADQGPGIPAKFHSKVFTKFFRTPGNPKTGSGLGLNIARQFVEAHEGEISFENNDTAGATFRFRLP